MRVFVWNVCCTADVKIVCGQIFGCGHVRNLITCGHSSGLVGRCEEFVLDDCRTADVNIVCGRIFGCGQA